MTLTEAIKHCEEVADYDCFTDDQRKCSEEHRQLADWLRDYKRLLDEPEIIRCKDCKWWDRYGEGRMGYCHAIKHHYYTTNWEIHILRTYRDDFYCADAEVREEEEE